MRGCKTMDLSLLVLLVSFIGTLDARNVRRANRRPGRQLPEPTTTEQPMDPMVFMNTAQLIDHWGYQRETYYLTTSDGYILTVNRIVKADSKLPPVIIQHGLFYNSDLFVLRGPKKDLPFILSDMGYDVWLPDLRGNTYSRNHTTLTPEQPLFWNFSFHEMGVIDTAEIIDFILAKTGQPSLIHIGHSMGTTVFYILGAVRPEYNERVRIHISLAPVCYLKHMKLNPLLRPFAQNAQTILKLARTAGMFELLPRVPEFSKMLYTSIQKPNIQKLFLQAFFGLLGSDYDHVNKTHVPTFVSHCPASSSVKTLQHFAQILLRDEFAWYSYGPEKNLQRYGSEVSPLYNLSAITTKISFHYSYNDYASHPTDVLRLAKIVPNVVGMYPIRFKQFNHVDYLWATDSRKLFMDDIITMIQKHSKPSRDSPSLETASSSSPNDIIRRR
ncbi:unnamed protein product [Bemisia tabaci]|uniref:Lipase n=2 Tax=Bemisia tabaci TaxID=7038 RepID=A0A9P0F1W0_BEMTA|nr:unnamed protein product [Bemisia tabaci]